MTPVSETTRLLRPDEQESRPTESDGVWWESEEDAANPINWTSAQKWPHVIIVSFLTFLVPLGATMFAPGAHQVMDEFENSNAVITSLVVSIYILGWALGPLVVAPLSEVHGRWIVYTVSNVLYVIFTLACAMSSSLTTLIVFRCLAGCVGSTPMTIGGGTISDLVPLQQRGFALSIYMLGPVLGPCIGPVVGGSLADLVGWRWIFWSLAIVFGAMTLVQMLFMRETYTATILQRKTRRLQKETGNMELRSKLDSGLTGRQILFRALIRPTKMTLLSPINILLSLASVFINGLLFLLVTTFPMVFARQYAFSARGMGLAFLGIGIGNVFGLLAFTFTSDRYIKARTATGKAKPEDRLIPVLISGPLLALGLFWYGWSAQARAHWAVPIAGSSFIGMGNILFFSATFGYLVDAFTTYAASAIAANTVLRSVGGAFIPLVGASMYQTLGLGWGNSLLGVLALAFTPALALLYIYGEEIRLRYPIKP